MLGNNKKKAHIANKTFHKVRWFFKDSKEVEIEKWILAGVLGITEKKLNAIIIYLEVYDEVLSVSKIEGSDKCCYKYIGQT